MVRVATKANPGVFRLGCREGLLFGFFVKFFIGVGAYLLCKHIDRFHAPQCNLSAFLRQMHAD